MLLLHVNLSNNYLDPRDVRETVRLILCPVLPENCNAGTLRIHIKDMAGRRSMPDNFKHVFTEISSGADGSVMITASICPYTSQSFSVDLTGS